MSKINDIYLSLGSNKGNRLFLLQQAVRAISEKIGDIKETSSVYQTASWGFKSNDFLNICLKITTIFSAEEVLQKTQEIERILKRNNKNKSVNTYSDRTIDIDILLFDDCIVNSEKLTIPHALMHQRNFVLVPLAEIAPEKIHPIFKKNIANLLKKCTDSENVIKTHMKLEKPITLSEKYNFIAIEGNIGSGKTSFATMLSKRYNAKLITEPFAENPFLSKFYKDVKKYAFPLEMNFLADRCKQLIDEFSSNNNFVVSDYYVVKSLIFAKINLSEQEYYLFDQIFNLLYKSVITPNLYVYLYQNSERLLENIKNRGRAYEQSIKISYLNDIQQGYLDFIESESNLNVKIIDITDLDFVKNKDDFQKMISILR